MLSELYNKIIKLYSLIFKLRYPEIENETASIGRILQ